MLSDIKRARGVVKKNAGASLIDVGDGVLCLEFHSKMNSLGDDQVAMMHAGIEETAQNFQAMIIANQGENFSVGANLMLVLLAAQEGEWDELNAAVNALPAGQHGHQVRAEAGGGGAVRHDAGRRLRDRAACRARAGVGRDLHGPGGSRRGRDPGGRRLQGDCCCAWAMPRQAFELIGYAKVSTSAEDARQLGLLRDSDGISMNPERLIADAKALALLLAPNYVAGRPAQRHQSGRRQRLCAAEDGRLHGARGRLHHRLRCRGR